MAQGFTVPAALTDHRLPFCPGSFSGTLGGGRYYIVKVAR